MLKMSISLKEKEHKSMLQMSIQDKYNVSRGFDSRSLSDEVLGNWDFNLRNYHYM